MANVYTCDDYVIFSILEKHTQYGENTIVDVYDYWVTLRRLPESSYSMNTEIHIEAKEYSANLLPNGLSNENFIANVLPIVNTHLASFDAEFSEDSIYTPINTDGYTPKI